MRDITKKLIDLLSKGYCSPQIAQIARKIKEPSTTIHYNIKKLEKEKRIVSYKAIFDFKKIDRGFCAYCLINLSPGEYNAPEDVAKELVKLEQIESIDLITGDWGMILKIRTKDQDEYYEFLKNVLSKKGIAQTETLISLKQFKTEFVEI